MIRLKLIMLVCESFGLVGFDDKFDIEFNYIFRIFINGVIFFVFYVN